MMHNGGFWGMNLIWWFIWTGMIFWLFATPYSIPDQRFRKDTAFDILRKRFAAGELTTEEYKVKKKLLEVGLGKSYVVAIIGSWSASASAHGVWHRRL